MKTNMGTIDRWLRILVGFVIIGLGIYFKNWIGLVGLVFLITGLVRFCPLYKILGNCSTCKKP